MCEGRGRPKAAESRQRRAEFLRLVAAGVPEVEAAKQARLGPWAALAIVTSADYQHVVDALRASGGVQPTLLIAEKAQAA